MCDGPRIEAHDLSGLTPPPFAVAPPDLRAVKEASERETILAALDRHHWAMAETAKALGISRKNLWEKMRRHHIERDDAAIRR